MGQQFRFWVNNSTHALTHYLERFQKLIPIELKRPSLGIRGGNRVIKDGLVNEPGRLVKAGFYIIMKEFEPV